jgi:hypothetical protein
MMMGPPWIVREMAMMASKMIPTTTIMDRNPRQEFIGGCLGS